MMIRTATMVMMMAAAAGGCLETGSTTAEDIQPLPVPMVSAERDGAHLDIYELTPGKLAIIASGDLPDAIEGKNPVEAYELIAAAPAPAALVERQARIAAAQLANATDSVGSVGDVADPARARISNLSATDFQASYCDPSSADFDYCWTNRTNNFEIPFYNIKWIHSHVNTYSGTLTHSMTYRSALGSWHLINSDTVSGSSYVSTFDEDANGDYEVKLTNATGDGYHLAIHGDF